MRLDSVRSLKLEMVDNFPVVVAEAAVAAASALAAQSRSKVTGVRRQVALGVSPGARKGDFKLAIRIQSADLNADRAAVDALVKRAKGEADVRYVGRIAKQDAPLTSRVRPLLVGCSVGHRDITAGTLGGFVTRKGVRGPLMLSNNHVLANEGRARLRDPIYQPGPHDGGIKKRNLVGKLTRFVPIEGGGVRNLVDSAIARVNTGVSIDATTLPGLGTLMGVRAVAIEPGGAVAKVGRTTGVTRGRVTAIELDNVVVSYETGAFAFDDQIEIEGAEDGPFSRGGDSGSIIVDDEGFAIGQLFAGGDQGGSNGLGLTYASPISVVLDKLGVSLLL